jgi:hypothetical protein
MNAQHYPNLTVIDDSEIQSIADHIEERAVTARLPQSAKNIIEHIQLRDAIQESFLIDIKKISHNTIRTTLSCYTRPIQKTSCSTKDFSKLIPSHFH